MRKVAFEDFRSFGQPTVAPLTAALLSEIVLDGFHARLPFKIIFARFDLPLPVFRGSKGRIKMNSLLQQLRRPLCITCFSQCSYHMVYGVQMDLLSHAPLG